MASATGVSAVQSHRIIVSIIIVHDGLSLQQHSYMYIYILTCICLSVSAVAMCGIVCIVIPSWKYEQHTAYACCGHAREKWHQRTGLIVLEKNVTSLFQSHQWTNRILKKDELFCLQSYHTKYSRKKICFMAWSISCESYLPLNMDRESPCIPRMDVVWNKREDNVLVFKCKSKQCYSS